MIYRNKGSQTPRRLAGSDLLATGPHVDVQLHSDRILWRRSTAYVLRILGSDQVRNTRNIIQIIQIIQMG